MLKSRVHNENDTRSAGVVYPIGMRKQLKIWYNVRDIFSYSRHFSFQSPTVHFQALKVFGIRLIKLSSSSRSVQPVVLFELSPVIRQIGVEQCSLLSGSEGKYQGNIILRGHK